MFRKATFKPFYIFAQDPGARLPSPQYRALCSVQVISFVHDWRRAFLRWFSASFLTLVLAYALLVVVGEIPRFGYPGMPSLPLGASLQASGDRAQGGALTVPAVSGPRQAPGPKDRDAWAPQPGRTAADLATARRVSLRTAAAPTQPSRRGQYALSTVFSGLRPILTMPPMTIWALAVTALLAFLLGRAIGRRPAPGQAEGCAEPAPSQGAIPVEQQSVRPLPLLQRAPQALRWVVIPRVRQIADLVADWERGRLVPT